MHLARTSKLVAGLLLSALCATLIATVLFRHRSAPASVENRSPLQPRVNAARAATNRPSAFTRKRTVVLRSVPPAKRPYPFVLSPYTFSQSSQCHIDSPSLYSHAARGWKIITSADENPYYLSFWRPMARMWKKYGHEPVLAFVTRRGEDDLLVAELRRYGQVVLLQPVDFVAYGILGKIARSYLASQYDRELCTVIDIDLYLFKYSYLRDALKCVPENHLMAVGYNMYFNTVDEGKYPMYYSSALGSTFREFVNPDNSNFEGFVRFWQSGNVFDAKETPGVALNQYSDESTYRRLIYQWSRTWNSTRVTHIRRQDTPSRTALRIDRSAWPKTMPDITKFTDSFPIRPFYRTYDLQVGLLEQMGIAEPKEDRRWNALMETVL